MPRASYLFITVMLCLCFLFMGSCYTAPAAPNGHHTPPDSRPPESAHIPKNGHSKGNGGSHPTDPKLSGHVWDRLAGKGGEDSGYGMYTYVLFPGKTKNLNNEEEKKSFKRLNELLERITFEPPVSQSISTREKRVHNIFYIPVTGNVGSGAERTSFSVEEYDSALAQRYIVTLRSSVSDRGLKSALNNTGPFLVSVFQPLGKQNSGEFPLLYADLTKAHSGSVRQITTIYRDQLIDDSLDDEIERFRTFKGFVLDTMLDMNDCLLIAKAKLSSWLDFFD